MKGISPIPFNNFLFRIGRYIVFLTILLILVYLY